MARLDAEVKQITHAIRMAADNVEIALVRALDGHYARAADEAYALIREAPQYAVTQLPLIGMCVKRRAGRPADGCLQ